MGTDWLAAAMATEPELGSVDVEGTEVSYRAWGPEGASGIVLIHGGGAHARWWDHIGPLLASGRRVVAMDLSGHGDSGRRARYSIDLWAVEVLAVAAAARTAPDPVVVGHSMGGFVAYATAMQYGDRLEGVVTIDSPVRDLTLEEKAAQRGSFRNVRSYATKAELMKRWRPVPDQERPHPEINEHIAETSVRETAEGWSWKFDPNVFQRGDGLVLGNLHQVECRVAVYRAEYGLLSAEMADAVYDRLGRLAPTIELAGTGHAPMLDQPLALVAALRTLLADWQHSVPTR